MSSDWKLILFSNLIGIKAHTKTKIKSKCLVQNLCSKWIQVNCSKNMSEKTDCSNLKQKGSSVQSNFQPKIVCQYTLIKQPLDHQESNTQTKANE